MNTTHYSIVDNQGNAVAVTYTLNEWFGAKVTAANTGILLNNEMDDFTVKLGVPNLYGLVQGQANAIAPGKRPLSSMSPTIVSREGKPLMVIGAAGGSRIITAVVHCILNVIDYGMNIQEAIDAPRFHQQWLPDTTNVDAFALSPDTRRILVAMGHRLSDLAGGGPRGRHSGRGPVLERQAARQRTLLWRQRFAARNRVGGRLLNRADAVVACRHQRVSARRTGAFDASLSLRAPCCGACLGQERPAVDIGRTAKVDQGREAPAEA